jgi:rod shape-determining protein MreD
MKQLFRRVFNKRARAWSTPTMGNAVHAGDGLFKLGSAAPVTILRPVNPLFVVFTLLVALLLNLLPWGNWQWMPDCLGLVLLFWICREPRLVGFGTAFLLGLLMDMHDATVFGEHALAYVLLAYAATSLSRRLPSFNRSTQALHIWPILLAVQIVVMVVRVFFGGSFPGWLALLLAPTFAAALWPVASWLLLAPQRKPLDVDKNRPL